MPSVVHYGAIPRTYEHPQEEDEATGLVGDGDPLDVVDVSDGVPTPGTRTGGKRAGGIVAPGDIVPVRVIGALAMQDDDAADWKVVVIRLTDPLAATLHGTAPGTWCA